MINRIPAEHVAYSRYPQWRVGGELTSHELGKLLLAGPDVPVMVDGAGMDTPIVQLGIAQVGGDGPFEGQLAFVIEIRRS